MQYFKYLLFHFLLPHEQCGNMIYDTGDYKSSGDIIADYPERPLSECAS